MKKLYNLILVSIILLFNNEIKAQVNKQDSLALVDLYKTTHGAKWNNSKNWLKGPVNTWYGITVKDSRVTAINLSANNLTDSLTATIGDLTALTDLDIRSNMLTSNIPNSFGKLQHLQHATLYNNQLSGSIPASIGELSSLVVLDLSLNKLTGSLPDSIGKLFNLSELYITTNKLTGVIPSTIGKLSKLTWLSLFNNQLTGNLPSSIGALKNLISLNLSTNQFSGNIPNAITNLSNLLFLDISSNQFRGIIPNDIDKLINLSALSLRDNKLTGTIPASIGNLANLSSLDLTNNQLTDTIPQNICNLSRLSYLDLGYNKLTGSVPENIGYLINLQSLSLNNNLLGGVVTKSIKNFTNLFFLDFSYNNFKGEFPFPETPIPCNFNLSHNHFTEDKNVLSNKYDLLGYVFYLNNNSYNFNGIELLSKIATTITYSPQAEVDVHEHNNTISVYAGGTLKKNTYKWYKDGLLVATIIGDSTYTPTANGNYSVTINNSIAKKLTLHSDTIAVNAIDRYSNLSGIQVNKNRFSVYPNPANTSTTVSFNSTGYSTIKLTDVEGSILLTKTINANGKTTIQLDLSMYASGVYYVSVINGNNQTQTVKLIKE